MAIALESLVQEPATTSPFAARRGVWMEIGEDAHGPLSAQELEAFETVDMIYRSMCAMGYNYVPTSGHPGDVR